MQAQGRIDDALTHYRRALELKPDYVPAYWNMGRALAACWRFKEAVDQYQRALQLNPEDADAHHNLAWLRATCPQAALRDAAQAVEHAQRAASFVEASGRTC